MSKPPVARSLRLIVFALFVVIAGAAPAQPVSDPRITDLTEMRYCGPPKRDVLGNIIRRSDVRTAFKRVHSCPVTGLRHGACPGWAIDHIIPLYCGGCDSVSNLQWLPTAIKSAAGTLPKDRWERQIYCIGGLE